MSSKGKFWFIPLVFLCLISFGSMADNTVLANALDPMSKDLHASVSQMQFLNIVFSLTAGSMMIGAGLLGGRIGWKRMLLAGTVVFMVAEIIAATTTSITIMTYVARVCAGFAASLSIPAVIGIIPQIYKGKKLAFSFAMLGVVVALASSIVPIVSGFFIVSFGWRFCFFLLLGLFVICFFGALVSIDIPKKKNVNNSKFDVVGLLLLFIGLSAIVFTTAKVTDWGLIYPVDAPFTLLGLSPSIPLISAGIFILSMFWFYEKSREKKHGPSAVLVPAIMLKDHAILEGIIMSSFVFYTLGGVMFSIVLYMQIVMQENAIMTGVYLFVLSLGMSISSIATPVAFKRDTPKHLCQMGIILSGVGSFILAAGISYTSINILFYIGLFMVGVGVGMVMSQASFAVSKSIKDPTLVSHSGGIQGAARNIGQCLGIALVGLVLIYSLSTSIKTKVTQSDVLSPAVKEHIFDLKKIGFVSSAGVEKALEKMGASTTEVKEAVDINVKSRSLAMRFTMIFMAISSFFFLMATGGIINRKIEDLNAELAPAKES